MDRKSVYTSLWLGGLVMLVYVWFAWLFAYERVLNTDNSTCFINILNEMNFFFPEFRYGTILVQIPVLLAISMKASLGFLIHLFSLSYALLYLGIFLVLVFWINHKPAAVGLAMGLILGLSQSFFHPVTETHQAIAYSFLFYGAWFSKMPSPIWKYLLAFCGLILALLVHPIAIWLVAFLIGWGFVIENKYNWKKILLPGFALLLFLLLRALFTIGSYDQEQYNHLFTGLANLENLLTWNSTQFLVSHVKLFLCPFLFWITGIGVLISKKNYPALLVLVLAPPGFLLMAAATFSGGDSQMMMEKAFLPSWAMIAMAFATLLPLQFRLNWLFPALIATAAVVAFGSIYKSGQSVFRKRIQVLDRFIELNRDNRQTKFLSNIDQAPDIWRYNHWATAIDVLLRSSATTGKSITLYLAKPAEDLRFVKQSNAFLFAPWWRDRTTDCLNPVYFHFEPQPYDSINLLPYE